MRTPTRVVAVVASAITCSLLTAGLTTPAQAMTLMCGVPVFVTPIEGTAGDDVIQGTSGVDVIYGNGGNDTIYGKGGNDVLDGGPGADTLYGAEGDDCLMGQAGKDTLYGGKGVDDLFGQDGDDSVDTGACEGAQPDEVADGGDGQDWLIIGTTYLTYSNFEFVPAAKGWYCV